MTSRDRIADFRRTLDFLPLDESWPSPLSALAVRGLLGGKAPSARLVVLFRLKADDCPRWSAMF